MRPDAVRRTHVVATILLVAAALSVARADGDGAGKPPQPAPPAGKAPEKPAAPPVAQPKPKLPWIDGWLAGLSAARERKCHLLVYVTQDNPPAERCRWLEKRVFEDPGAPQIAANCVMVRLRAGADITAEVRDFNRRYGVEAFPALYVMNSDGHLVVPSMDSTVDSVLRALEYAKQDEVDFQEAARGASAADQKQYRQRLEHRMAWEEVLPYHEEDATKRASPQTFTRLAETYRRLGRVNAERGTLAMALDVFEEDAMRGRWRIRLATMPLDEVSDPEKFHRGTIQLLTHVAKQFAAERNRVYEAEVRYAIGLAHAELRECEEAKAEFDAVVSLAPNLATAPKALLGKAAVHWYEYDYDNCRRACRRILDDYPKSPEARPAKHTIESCDERTKGESSPGK
jgi:tetratricopeptide (TPR) repeat protein